MQVAAAAYKNQNKGFQISLEMLDTLRGTGIQVELHEVKMIASIDSIMVLEGCYRIPPRR